LREKRSGPQKTGSRRKRRAAKTPFGQRSAKAVRRCVLKRREAGRKRWGEKKKFPVLVPRCLSWHGGEGRFLGVGLRGGKVLLGGIRPLGGGGLSLTKGEGDYNQMIFRKSPHRDQARQKRGHRDEVKKFGSPRKELLLIGPGNEKGNHLVKSQKILEKEKKERKQKCCN